jgi:hypothetical protein
LVEIRRIAGTVDWKRDNVTSRGREKKMYFVAYAKANKK